MALTPLTPEQVGGSLDTGEIRALHVSGPNIGMMLVYRSDDSDLQAAHESGEVVIEGLPTFVVWPTFTNITPDASPSVANVSFVVTGENIPPGVFVEIGEIDAENIVSTSTTISGTVDLTGVGPKDAIASFWVGQEEIGFLPFTITAAPAVLSSKPAPRPGKDKP